MGKDKYDIFVSHAVEDKVEVTNELTCRLKDAGLAVWYSGEGLQLGKSIADAVNAGMVASDFGIIVLSPMYLQARWALTELEALFALETTGKLRILPLWHNLSVDDVLEQLPLLAGRYGLSTSVAWEDLICKIVQVVKGNQPLSSHDHLNQAIGEDTPLDSSSRSQSATSSIGTHQISNNGAVSWGGQVTINATYAAGKDLHLTIGK